MKLIGNTNDGHILECSKSELARLIGYHGYYSDGYITPKVGAEIQVSAMYDKLYAFECCGRDVKEARNRLNSILKSLEDVVPVIERGEGKE